MAADYVQKEDGTGDLQLEDGTGNVLLEDSTAGPPAPSSGGDQQKTRERIRVYA